MSVRSADVWLQQQQQQQQHREPAARVPADHVLFSGAILFPGAFDQRGCPLVVFPVEAQSRLSTILSKAEVVDFINFCLSQHHKTQRSRLVSVVADLREASASSTRFIAETLLLLEKVCDPGARTHRVELISLQQKSVHSAYIIQPKKKDVLRLLCKLWGQSQPQPQAFKKVLLKEVFELANYIDRSQLMASLGGYFVYSHQSWASFTKEMNAFEERFASVKQRLPAGLSSLQTLSRLPLPNSVSELQIFCSTTEDRFQQVQRELGLHDALGHCKLLLDKLRAPDHDPHFQAMAGTVLFTLHFARVLQNHRRIDAALQKVELLWEQLYSKSRLQLEVVQMRDAALQITEQIEGLLQDTLQPYNMQMAEDAAEAERLCSDFHSSVYAPAMSLVVAADEVIHTLTGLLSDAWSRERWILDLQRLKDKLQATVHLTLQTLQAVAKYHRFYNKAHSWYRLVLSENFLQDFLSEEERQKSWGPVPVWRKRLCVLLQNSPPPHMEELVHLGHLASVIPDKRLQHEGRQLSHRCLTLRWIMLSSKPVPLPQLQTALQWQFEHLQNSRSKPTEHSTSDRSSQEPNPRMKDRKVDLLRPGPTVEGKPSSLSSFDSGFEGAGSSVLEGRVVTPDSQALNHLSRGETKTNLSDSGGFGSLGNSSRPSAAPGDALQSFDLEQRDSCNISIRQTHEELCPAAAISWTLNLRSLEDSDLSSVTHVLSSTVTEAADQATDQTTDQATAGPSMLWDSYDLHEQYLDATECATAASLKDWDVQEEENLCEVERTLERTEQILEEEERVLAQEVQLKVLLQDDAGPPPLLSLDKQMSTDESKVVDLHQFDPESQTDTDFGGSFEPGDWSSKPDAISELEEVRALDQKILEEELKIALLRREKRLDEAQQRTSETLEEQDAQILLLKDKMEQGNLEGRTVRPRRHVKGHKDRATRVIRCSIMSRAESEDDRAICKRLSDHCGEGRSPGNTRQFSSEPPENDLSEVMELHKTSPPPSDSPVSLNTTTTSRNLEQASSVESVSSGSSVEEAIEKSLPCLQPVPKPRKNPPMTLSAESKSLNTEVDVTLYASSTTPGLSGSLDVLELVPLTSRDLGCDVPTEDTTDRGGGIDDQGGGGIDDQGGGGIDDQGGGGIDDQDGDGGIDDQGGDGGIDDQDGDGGIDDQDGDGGIDDQDGDGGGALDQGGGGGGALDQGGGGGGALDQGGGGGGALDQGGGGGGALDQDGGGGGALDQGGGGGGALDQGGGGGGALDQGGGVGVALDQGGGGGGAMDQGGGGGGAMDQGGGGGGAMDQSGGGGGAMDQGGGGGGAMDQGGGGGGAMDQSGGGGGAMDQSGGGGGAMDQGGGGGGALDQGRAPVLCPNLELLSNNNNNNNCLRSEGGAQTASPDVDPDQIEDLGSCEDHVRPVPVCTLLYDLQHVTSASGTRDQCSNTQLQPSDFGSTIVLDTGSGLMKAGFADEDLPSVIFPTIMGEPKYEEVMNGSSEKELYVGYEAQHMRGVLALRRPIKHGVIHNWDDMEKIWQHTFDLLRVDPENHPVLLTEAPMNPVENRQRAVEIMFEFFRVPFCYVSMQAVLALYAAGRTTGVVLDSGDGVTHSVPVYEGYVLSHAVQRLPLAGADISAHLTKLLQEQGVCMRTSAEQEIVREMKEKCCYVALRYEDELRDGCGEASYTLPDGKMVTLTSERIRAPEILFKPELIGRDHSGLHESLYKSILSSDLDLRRDFLGNVLLSGGTTLLPGLPERLEAELSRLVPGDPRSAVRVVSPSDRDFSVWCGGAVLANLSSFCSLWISQSEYEEHGPQIVLRKCF